MPINSMGAAAVTLKHKSGPVVPLGTIQGGGQMGESIRAVDWSKTGLGPAESWSQSLRTTLDLMLAMPQPACICWGPDARLLYNDEFIPILGSRHGQALARPIAEVWPELADTLQPAIRAVFAGEPQRFVDQEFAIGGHGEQLVAMCFTATWTPLREDTGQIGGFFCVALDTTKRKRAEQDLSVSREALNQILQQLPVGIVILRGPDFVVESANPLFRTLVNGRNLVGQRFADVFPETGQVVWRVLRHVLHTGTPWSANEWHVRYDLDQDGLPEDHWFNLVYHPLCELDGAVSGLMAVVAEVTSQVLARQETEFVNRELEQFARVTSHDLQEPLRMVRIYTQQIVRRVGKADADLNEYALFVSRGVTRMQHLIRDLLAYSRAVRRQGEPAGTADLSDSLAEALFILRNRIEEAAASIAAPSLPEVRGDTEQFTQVFQNLISNALKYRKPEHRPKIEITAQRKQDLWVISIRDNGMGFEQAYAETIFGLFSRLHTSAYPGTGPGLAICRHIVDRYGGRIWAEGTPGEGATFYFTALAAEPT